MALTKALVEVVRVEMGPFCESISWAAKTYLRIFSFLTGTMALWVMGLRISQVSCLIRISLVGPDGMNFSTVLVTRVKNSGNGGLERWLRD